MTQLLKITNNFTLAELLYSETAIRLGYQEQFTPDITIVRNMELLAVNILQPLRDAIKSPIHISSGYRCERVNNRTGGKPTSQHLLGQAADIQNYELGNEYIFKKIQELHLPFDQLINEYNFSWVHVSFGPRHRRQIIVI